MKNSRNKLILSFKFHAVLSSVMKAMSSVRESSLCPVYPSRLSLSSPLGYQIHCPADLSTCGQIILILLNNGPKAQL